MKKLLVLFLLLCVTGTAMGFQVDISGIYENRYVYVSQVGRNSLFGNLDVAQSQLGSGQTTLGLPGPIFNTVVPEGLSSKGSDGSFWIQRFVLSPKVVVNQAVRINSELSFQGNPNGLYRGGQNWMNTSPYAGWSRLSSRTPEAENVIAVPGLRTLWLDMDIPWGRFSVGRMPFSFGCGWTMGDYRADLMRIVVPDGPFSYMFGFGLSDTGEFTDTWDSRDTNRTPLTVASSFDKNEQKQWDTYAAIVYRDGPVEIGLLGRVQIWRAIHATPFTNWTLRDDASAAAMAMLSQGVVAGGAGQDGTTAEGFPIHSDIFFNTYTGYVKYSQGRFFFNGEYGYQQILVKRDGARPISGGPMSWLVETGVVVGPSKTTIFHVYSSGHQRAGGMLNFAASTGTSTGLVVSDKWNQYQVAGGRHGAIDPYQFLIGLYGSGNNSYDGSGYAVFYDYLGLGLRFDYAVASNLNLFGSWLYSRRASNNSSGWGQYGGGIYTAPLATSDVPDNELGQEFDFGLGWKLLENVSLDAKFGHWKPGKWFKHAYTDLSTMNTIADPAAGTGTENGVRINPDRTIDPISGFQGTISVNF